MSKQKATSDTRSRKPIKKVLLPAPKYELMDNNDEFVQYCIGGDEIIRLYKGVDVGAIVHPSLDFDNQMIDMFEEPFKIH